jgi:maleamate amidohydrolase
MTHVWDQFLTDQDRKHANLTTNGRVGFGVRPALLMIDFYRWVFGDEPEALIDAVPKWSNSCGLAAWQALPHAQQLLGAARKAGIPIIHTTGLEEGDSGIQSWNRHGRPKPARIDPEAQKRSQRRFEIISEVAPLPGEVILRKAAPSAFFATPLASHLIRHSIDTLIVAGETTSGCVRASVTDGCSLRYRMIVAEECVFDRHESCHAVSLFDMDQKYADVLHLAEIIDWLQEWKTAQREPTKVAAQA